MLATVGSSPIPSFQRRNGAHSPPGPAAYWRARGWRPHTFLEAVLSRKGALPCPGLTAMLPRAPSSGVVSPWSSRFFRLAMGITDGLSLPPQLHPRHYSLKPKCDHHFLKERLPFTGCLLCAQLCMKHPATFLFNPHKYPEVGTGLPYFTREGN